MSYRYQEYRNPNPPRDASPLGEEKIGESQVYVTTSGKFLAWIGDQWLSRASIAALRKEAAGRATPTMAMCPSGLTGHYREQRWDPVTGRYVLDSRTEPKPFHRVELARYERSKWTLANGNRIHESGQYYAVDEALERDLQALIQEHWALEDRWKDLIYQRGRPISHDANGSPVVEEPRAVQDAAWQASRTPEEAPMQQ